MGFTPIPITWPGSKHVHSDGLMVVATDSSTGMYFTFDEIDALKNLADTERRQQVSEGRVPAVHA